MSNMVAFGIVTFALFAAYIGLFLVAGRGVIATFKAVAMCFCFTADGKWKFQPENLLGGLFSFLAGAAGMAGCIYALAAAARYFGIS